MKVFRCNRNSLIAAVLAVLVVMPLLAPQDASAYTLKKIWSRFSATAGETLATGQAVSISDTDGYAYKADANDAGLVPAVGIVGKGGASGAKVEIVTHGIFSGWSTLSEGTYGYLSETAGAVTQSSPSYSQPLGVAINTTDYYFNIKNYFDTSALTALGVLSGATPIILEGATADAYETTIAPTDPTADRTITLPDRTGIAALETVTVTTDNNGSTLTAANIGQIQVCTGAGVTNLPEASTWIGGTIPFVVNASANCDVNPDDADTILGLTNAAGDAVRCAAIGSTIIFKAISASEIVAFGPNCVGGSWADVN